MTTTPAAEEWAPPVLPPLPDTKGWSVERISELALERCRLREGHKQPLDPAVPGLRMACKRCRQEALLGRDPLAAAGPVDLAALYDAIPPPDKGFSHLHRRLLEVLAGRDEYDLQTLQGLVEGGGQSPEGYTTESISARLRDLRKMGYPIARRVDTSEALSRRVLYWLAA